MWYQGANPRQAEYRRDYKDRICEDAGMVHEVLPEGEMWRPIQEALTLPEADPRTIDRHPGIFGTWLQQIRGWVETTVHVHVLLHSLKKQEDAHNE